MITSVPLTRGAPSERSVASTWCLVASKRARTAECELGFGALHDTPVDVAGSPRRLAPGRIERPAAQRLVGHGAMLALLADPSGADRTAADTPRRRGPDTARTTATSEQWSGCASFHSTVERMRNPDGTVLAHSRGSTRQVLVGGVGLDARHHRRARVGALPAPVRDRAGQLPQPRLPDRGRQRRVPGQLRRRGRHLVVPGDRRQRHHRPVRRIQPGRAPCARGAPSRGPRDLRGARSPHLAGVLRGHRHRGSGHQRTALRRAERPRPRGRRSPTGRHLHHPGPPRRRR